MKNWGFPLIFSFQWNKDCLLNFVMICVHVCLQGVCVGGGRVVNIHMHKDVQRLEGVISAVVSTFTWVLKVNIKSLSYLKKPQNLFWFPYISPYFHRVLTTLEESIKKNLCCTSFAITAVSSLLTPCPLRFVWFWSPFSSLAYSKTTINWTRITILSKSTATVITPI